MQALKIFPFSWKYSIFSHWFTSPCHFPACCSIITQCSSCQMENHWLQIDIEYGLYWIVLSWCVSRSDCFFTAGLPQTALKLTHRYDRFSRLVIWTALCGGKQTLVLERQLETRCAILPIFTWWYSWVQVVYHSCVRHKRRIHRANVVQERLRLLYC